MLKIYNSELDLFDSLATTGSEYSRQGPFRTFFDGRIGGAYEELVHIRNDDAGKYYTNIVASYARGSYADDGEYGNTGWSVKFLYGERRPTEGEWNEVKPGDSISLPDIGSTDAADTSTYHPIWIRVFCPGNAPAQIRENQSLVITFYERVVGA
jgi:hypothetical protein